MGQFTPFSVYTLSIETDVTGKLPAKKFVNNISFFSKPIFKHSIIFARLKEYPITQVKILNYSSFVLPNNTTGL